MNKPLSVEVEAGLIWGGGSSQLVVVGKDDPTVQPIPAPLSSAFSMVGPRITQVVYYLPHLEVPGRLSG